VPPPIAVLIVPMLNRRPVDQRSTAEDEDAGV
jgi:hypothetical protein